MSKRKNRADEAIKFVNLVARMQTEEEFGNDSPPFEDWIGTLSDLIVQARDIADLRDGEKVMAKKTKTAGTNPWSPEPVIRYTKTAQIEFIDVAYSLTRSDLRMIESALEIVNPDSERGRRQAEYLRNMFATLAERPKP